MNNIKSIIFDAYGTLFDVNSAAEKCKDKIGDRWEGFSNYWNNRRVLENKGMRFMSECDSELIAVYIAQKMREGASLEEGMKDSLTGLDGVFTYFVATKDSLGMAKDTMAAKPLVLYESDDLVAMGSEEIAIRSVLPQEIDTYDPFDGEVKVWQI